jgi:hypothetical protein
MSAWLMLHMLVRFVALTIVTLCTYHWVGWVATLFVCYLLVRIMYYDLSRIAALRILRYCEPRNIRTL